MWAISDQYKEKLNRAASREQRLEDNHAKVSIFHGINVEGSF